MALIKIVIALLVSFCLNHCAKCLVLKEKHEDVAGREVTNNGSCWANGCDIFCSFIDGTTTGSRMNELVRQQSNRCERLSLRLENCRFPSNDFPEYWLSNLNRKYSIKSLEMIDTYLHYFNKNSFAARCFRNTAALVLDNIQNRNLVSHTFNHLENLKTLKILNLPLDFVSNGVLKTFASTLKFLSIESSITNFNNIVFNFFNGVDFPALETLSLAHNDLSDLELAQVFESNRMTSLHTINFENCFIRDLQSEIFGNLPNLRSVNLQGNELEHLPGGIFGQVLINKSAEIRLANNPWHCDCDLVSLRELMLSHRQQFPGLVLCYTPMILHNDEVGVTEICPDVSIEIDE